jgi:hypothetical protein
MPAPSGKSEFDYPDFARFEMRHNAGYDFLRMLDWCRGAGEEDFRKVFVGYARNPLAVLLGGAAIEAISIMSAMRSSLIGMRSLRLRGRWGRS